MENIYRISIIGGPGTGKSTLANNLGKDLNLPVYHLDGIHHLENWKERDKEERDKIIIDKLDKPKWIMDGTYKSTLEKRVKASDLIIFLNYSTVAILKGILSRYFKNRGKEKVDIPGCKERMTWKFLKFTIIWNKTRGNTIKDVLDKIQDKKIIIFENRRTLNKWYENKFNKRIEI